MITVIEGLAGRFQSDSLASTDNQHTHDGPIISDSIISPDYNLCGCAGVDHYDRGSPVPAHCRRMVGLQMTRSTPAAAIVWKHTVTGSSVYFRGNLSDNRPLALDGNPSGYFFANFDRQYTPKHDEWCAVFLVINCLAFKFSARL